MRNRSYDHMQIMNMHDMNMAGSGEDETLKCTGVHARSTRCLSKALAYTVAQKGLRRSRRK
jgi:hypothetical protein